MNKDSQIRIVSFSLALSAIFAGSTIYYGMKTARYERYITHMSDRAYSSIISSLNSAASSLEKMKYSIEGNYLDTLAANVWRGAATAKAAMSLLPLTDVELDQTEKFISQAGSYAYSVLQRGRDDSTSENVSNLSTTANQLTDQLWQVKTRINSGEIDFDNPVSAKSGDELTDVAQGFSDIEQQFPEMGSLIYDGPFSDHIEQMKAEFLEGKPEVDVDTALKNAVYFSSCEGLKHTGDVEGKIPVYVFSDGSTTVQVTKKGGFVLHMSKTVENKEATMSAEEAVDAAKKFLSKNGYKNMTESYYTVFENIITINFAYEESGVKVYTDLIKVSIDMSDGSCTGFESRGYIMSHRDRTLERPAVSFEDARSKISSELEVLDNSIAIIPTSGLNEVLCYEFLCSDSDGNQILVYIDVMTGEEENMLVLIEDENGTLTM